MWPETIHKRSHPGLHAQQHAFADALRNAESAAPLLPLLAGNAAQNQARLALYRGNVLANSIAALRQHFPVLEQIVGETFFEGLARAFWQAMPPTCANLATFGAQLPVFLETFEPTAHLPYLADVARLEWAVHQAEDAADLPVDAVSEEPAVLTMPGTSVLVSTFPIAHIWLAHQADSPMDMSHITWTAQGALVFRAGWRVQVAPLDAQQAHSLIEYQYGEKA
jgi:hypothetical protein